MGDNDSRRLPRVAVQQIVVVFDAMLDVELGRIVNLNREGFMLIGGSVKENCLYQLNFFLSEPIDEVSKISIGAECLWVRETVGDDRNWAGFHILDIADSDLKVIDELISQIDDH